MPTVTTLDQRIRAKAKQDASEKFYRDQQAFFTVGHAGTWTKEFTYDDYKEVKLLLEKFLYAIVIPVAEQKAIDQFHATYKKLLTEYPDLVQEGDDS